MPRRGGGGPRRHDRPPPHDPRPRPARHHGDPVRVRRRRRAGLRARAAATTATSSCTPTTSPTRACGPRTGPVRRPTTSAPPSSARCARRCRRSSTTPAPGRGSVSLPAAPAAAAMQRARRARGWRRSRPYHWLLYGESLWFDTTKARTGARLGAARTRTRRWSSSPTSGSSPTDASSAARHGSHHQSPVPMGLLARAVTRRGETPRGTSVYFAVDEARFCTRCLARGHRRGCG